MSAAAATSSYIGMLGGRAGQCVADLLTSIFAALSGYCQLLPTSTAIAYAALLNAALNFASASLESDVFSTRGL
jgi:hypothetical protein